MRPAPSNRIDERALSVWRLTGLIISILILLISITATILLFSWLGIQWWLAVLPIVLGLSFGILLTLLIPKVRYRRWRYQVSEGYVDFQHGILIIKRTLIPMARVQYVDTVQGPLLRRYGLASITISTAGGSHEIPALAGEVADDLRDHIAQLAQVADDV